MKILVIGRGVAALGFLEKLINSKLRTRPAIEITWLSAAEGYPACSLNSTALVALHGIRREASPLGSILNKGFFTAKKFFEEMLPDGVSLLKRYHVDSFENLERRFGHLNCIQEQTLFNNRIGISALESVFSINPKVFMNWWSDSLIERINQSNLKLVMGNDLITQLEVDSAIGLKKSYPFDYCVDGSGALGFQLGLKDEGAIALGHYLVFKDANFLSGKINESFVLTFKGHNLIYQKEYESIIFGGTNEDDHIYCPKLLELSNQLEETLSHFPFLKFSGLKKVYTGPRHKGLQRIPKIIRNDNTFHIAGLYKNGFSVCHDLGGEVVKALLNE